MGFPLKHPEEGEEGWWAGGEGEEGV